MLPIPHGSIGTMQESVVITGLGVVSPIGLDRESFWRACKDGRSGAVRLDSPWVQETGLDTRIAAPVPDFDPQAAGLEPRLVRVIDRTTQFALVAAREALQDAGYELGEGAQRGTLEIRGVPPRRVSTIVGSGIGGLSTLEASHAQWRERRDRNAVKRFALPMLLPNAPAGEVAIRFGARGECKAISTACAAGTMALGDAWRLLVAGAADVVLAGGAEGVASDTDGYALMGFGRLGTLSRRNDDPARASRPFDRDRDGFVLGEGAGMLVLERERHARARGAAVYARVRGYASNCDARSMMQLDESGDRIVELIGTALENAGMAPQQIDHVSAHGTSTRSNDRTEALALRRAFGPRCDDIPVTALKSMTGHCIAASGALESVALALSLREGLLTPTINYEHPDPECDLDVVANNPRDRAPRGCLKLSYGFGGHNACLVLTRE
jgi:3-oxoacyl-[acyl-carrier-protein] synthase II